MVIVLHRCYIEANVIGLFITALQILGSGKLLLNEDLGRNFDPIIQMYL